jgi:pantetheine-phosphate adenylyltransferase
MSLAVYPGSFDPVTNGHLDVIIRGSRLFDELIVAVADNSSKTALFTKEERVRMLRQLTRSIVNVRIVSFEGLLIGYVRSVKAKIILRGIRTLSDFEYEFMMALTNRTIAHDVETVFVMTSEKYAHVNSRLVKEAARLGADVSGLVPADVVAMLSRKLKWENPPQACEVESRRRPACARANRTGQGRAVEAIQPEPPNDRTDWRAHIQGYRLHRRRA